VNVVDFSLPRHVIEVKSPWHFYIIWNLSSSHHSTLLYSS